MGNNSNLSSVLLSLHELLGCHPHKLNSACPTRDLDRVYIQQLWLPKPLSSGLSGQKFCRFQQEFQVPLMPTAANVYNKEETHILLFCQASIYLNNHPGFVHFPAPSSTRSFSNCVCSWWLVLEGPTCPDQSGTLNVFGEREYGLLFQQAFCS